MPHRDPVVSVSQVSELEGHEGDVTAVVVVPPPAGAAATPAAKLASNCWTAGLDGVLIYWDFVAAEAVRKVQVGLPVHSMVSSSCCLSNFVALVIIGLYAELSEFEIKYANLHAYVLILCAQVIPNICRTSKGAEVSTPFAFVSVEDTSKPVNEPKALRGQMRIYDLTKGRKVGYPLAEVRFFSFIPSLIIVSFLTTFHMNKY